MKKVPTGYKREKQLAARFGFLSIPLSGSSFLAKDDLGDDRFQVQVKSTALDSFRVVRSVLKLLLKTSFQSRKFPLLLVDFVADDTQWVVLPANRLDEFSTLWQQRLREQQKEAQERGNA